LKIADGSGLKKVWKAKQRILGILSEILFRVFVWNGS
jgi:hypothetical protein